MSLEDRIRDYIEELYKEKERTPISLVATMYEIVAGDLEGILYENKKDGNEV